MSEEVKDMVTPETETPVVGETAAEGAAKTAEEVQETVGEDVKTPDSNSAAEKPEETMEDFASELEASYKQYEESHNRDFEEQEGPDAEKWANLEQMRADKTVTKVKIKEAVKAGVIAYIDDIQGFIPASQISTKYVEKLEDWVGQYLEVIPITVDVVKKRLVLSGREVQKEKEKLEKEAKLAAAKVGAVVEGVVDGIKDYGAFVRLENGLSGLVHVSQISKDRVKHPGSVLKEGQKITAKIIKNEGGKISLSMKALEPDEKKSEEVFNYKETGAAVTGLGALLKDIKF